MIALDYTQRISPAALKAAGVSTVFRYLSNSSASWKVISISEYRELVQAGINVILNWEFDAHDWNSTGGTAHGALAAAQAKTLGYPSRSVIFGSADFDMTRSDWIAKGKRYAQQFKAAVEAGGYTAGVYGPWDVLQWTYDEVGYRFLWQAGMSTSWSGGRNKNPHPLAQFRQRGHKTVGGIDADWNEILSSTVEDELTPDQEQKLNDIHWALTSGAYGPEQVRWATAMPLLQKAAGIEIDATALAHEIAQELKADPSLPVDASNVDAVAARVAAVFGQKLSQ